LPTFFIVLLLHFYLKQVFFKPLAKVLADRYEATAGARRQADEALAAAASKAAAYEEQIRLARNEIYREQEEQRRRWLDDQATQLAGARNNAQLLVSQARQQLSEQAEETRRQLAAGTQALADQITGAILEERAA
jgi:F-type H+-transporting ATPase subunit b